MKKIYTIDILCFDSENTCDFVYNDNFSKAYTSYEIAKNNLDTMIESEYKSLVEYKNAWKDFSIKNYINNDREECERELWFKDNAKQEEYLLTRYTIRKLEIEK